MCEWTFIAFKIQHDFDVLKLTVQTKPLLKGIELNNSGLVTLWLEKKHITLLRLLLWLSNTYDQMIWNDPPHKCEVWLTHLLVSGTTFIIRRPMTAQCTGQHRKYQCRRIVYMMMISIVLMVQRVLTQHYGVIVTTTVEIFLMSKIVSVGFGNVSLVFNYYYFVIYFLWNSSKISLLIRSAFEFR